MPLIDSNTHQFMPLHGEQHRSYTINTTLFVYNVPLNCNCILVQALAQNIRYTLDGTNPTTSSGFQMKASDAPIVLYMGNNVTFKFIGEASGAILQLQAGA